MKLYQNHLQLQKNYKKNHTFQMIFKLVQMEHMNTLRIGQRIQHQERKQKVN